MHQSVMPKETLAALAVRPGGSYIDGTLGGGGHARDILVAGAPSCRLLGVDRDCEAIRRCRERLSDFADRFTAVQASFADLDRVAPLHGFVEADGILLDIGVSSFQLDDSSRGFSFMRDGPLDMRMDPSTAGTAADFLRGFGDDWRALAKVLRDFGEQPQAGRVARAIVDAGRGSPIESTLQLADIVERALGGRRGAARHPATRVFQALRIAVNNELEALKKGLRAALDLLREGGRLAVLTFHSLEDRIVKQTFAAHAGGQVALHEGGSVWRGELPRITRVNRKPLTPDPREMELNPRARSAKLRIAERITEPRQPEGNQEV